jgi:SAM-dependent methyltransferase
VGRVSSETPALSFGGVAADYDRLRPSPAPDALSWLIPDPCEHAVDLAAGTGLFTRALAARVPEVIAVEPDARMREVFALRSADIEVREGRGEAIPVPDASTDLVTVSSAWHWLDPAVAPYEIARVLRDGGRLAVVWSHMTQDDRLPALDWEALGVRPHDRIRVARQRNLALPEGAPFGPVEAAEFSYPRPTSKADIVATLGTYSPVIALDEDTRARALGLAAERLEERFPGQDLVDVTITTHCLRVDRLGYRCSKRRSGVSPCSYT